MFSQHDQVYVCLVDLFQGMIEDEMYAQLRGIEQLGYNVQVNRRNNGGISGMSLVVQSSEYDPVYC